MKIVSTTAFVKAALWVCLMLLPLLSQAQTITLNHRNEPLQRVLKAITDQAGYKFVYAGSLINPKQSVSVNINSDDIRSVLDAVFRNTNIDYSIADKQVALSLKQRDSTPARQQDGMRRITGRVTDQNGHPLIGAGVIVEGTSNGTITDANGEYSLLMKDDPQTKLTYRYLGMESRTVTVGPRSRIDITLTVDNVVIDQVVITGYQTISKERSAGSYEIVSGTELQERALAAGSVLESLEGTAAGLNINLGPDGDKFLVRGVTSINSNRSPLFIVDGVSVPGGMIESMFNGNDIQSVTVLKDATAASIWGAQAANGVVVITTKSGTRGEGVEISYNGSFTFRGMPDYSYSHMMSSDMFIKNAAEVFDPVGYPWESTSLSIDKPILPHELPLYQFHLNQIDKTQRDAELNRLAKLDGREAYEKYMMSNSWLTNHSVSISGGNNNHAYYVSLGYQGQQGSNMNRSNEYKINARENINLTKWLQLDLSLNASYGTAKSNLQNFTVDDNPGVIGLTSLPYAVFHDEAGNELSFTDYLLNRSLRTKAEEFTGVNLDYYPIRDFRNTTQGSVSANIRANAGLTIDIIDGLKYEGRFSYYISNGKRETYTPAEAYNVRLDRVYATSTDGTTYLPSSGGYFRNYNSAEDAYTVRNQFSYDKTFGGRHQILTLLGQEIQQTKTGDNVTTIRGYDKQTMQGIFFDDYCISVAGVENPVLKKLGGMDFNKFDSGRYQQNETTYRFVSFYANAAYTLDQRYSLNASIRVDQSNLFGSDPSVQFKPIWSVGAVWNMARERFMENLSWINSLDLRASYGFSGNSPAPGQGGPYDIISATSDPTYSEFGLGYVIVTPANDKLTWEKTRTWNIGLGFGVLGNRLRGTVDVYDKKTTDLLANSPVDPSTGYTTVLQNIGTMNNRGFEITLGSRNVTNANFIWDTDLMLSYNKNKIVKMYIPAPYGIYDYVSREYAEGRPAGTLFAYRWAGLDPLDGAARIYDAKGEAIRSVQEIDDLSAIDFKGTTIPPWSGSMINTFRYKNFELSFMFVGNFGHKMRNDTFNQVDTRLNSNVHKDFDKRWRQPGDELYTDTPSFYTIAESPDRNGGDRFLRYADIGILDASYIKLRELSLGYYLPQNICRALQTKSIKLRVQATNLWTIAFNKEGIDPESHSLRYGARYERYKPTVSGSISVQF